MMSNHKGTKEGVKNETFCFFVTVQHPHLTSPIPSASLRTGKGEETFPRSESRTGLPRPWWEGLGEGGTDTFSLYVLCVFVVLLFPAVYVLCGGSGK